MVSTCSLHEYLELSLVLLQISRHCFTSDMLVATGQCIKVTWYLRYQRTNILAGICGQEKFLDNDSTGNVVYQKSNAAGALWIWNHKSHSRDEEQRRKEDAIGWCRVLDMAGQKAFHKLIVTQEMKSKRGWRGEDWGKAVVETTRGHSLKTDSV